MEEILWEMEDARMIRKRVAVDGVWLNIMCFKEEDGIRIEIEQELSGKRHKVFPDNRIELHDKDQL